MGRIFNIIDKVTDELFKPESHIVGDEFENYLRDSIFDTKWYVLVDKTHDYSQNNKDFVEKSLYPDFHFREKKNNTHFMVEAKFREDFTDGKVQWSNTKQLKRYKQIEKEEKIPIFLALGFSYSDDPEPLYVIPLKEIKYTTLTKSFLKKYKVNPEKALSPKKLFKKGNSLSKSFRSQTSVEVRINAGLKAKGHCIRCSKNIKLKPAVPYCKKCYSSWSNYKNEEYQEKYCHICSKRNKSTLIKPVCYPCYKKHKNKLEFQEY